MKRKRDKRPELAAALLALAGLVLLFTASPPANADGNSLSEAPLSLVTSCARLCGEGHAAAEWKTYLDGYSARRSLECRLAGLDGNAWRTLTDSPESVLCGCADAASLEKLYAVADKYGLCLHRDVSFPDSTDAPPLPEIAGAERLEPLYQCSDGAFGITGRLTVGGWVCSFLYEESPVGRMVGRSGTGSCDKYSSWRTVLPCGSEVWLDMGPYDSGEHSGFREVLVFFRDSERIVTVCGSVPNDRAGAEACAAAFTLG